MSARTRSPEPIEGLFVAHFGSIYRFAACRVGRDAALDIAAETFAQALRSFGSLDPERDARAWLFGVATNVLRHHRRAEERKIRAYAAFAGLHEAQREGAAHGVAEEELTRARLVEALVGLDARDRETLLLFAWADLSYEQIATALEIPLGTVRSRIHRARRSLRESLGENVVNGGGVAIVAGEEA